MQQVSLAGWLFHHIDDASHWQHDLACNVWHPKADDATLAWADVLRQTCYPSQSTQRPACSCRKLSSKKTTIVQQTGKADWK